MSTPRKPRPSPPRTPKTAPAKAAPAPTDKAQTKSDEVGRRRIGPAAREEAYQMISGGVSLRAISRELNITVDTVMAWRDSPEGKARLDELRAERDEEFGAILGKARKRLESLIPRAVERLGDALESTNLNVVVRAAREVLDRAGMPRTEIHEERGGELDLSGLSIEELEQLRALHAKAAGGGA